MNEFITERFNEEQKYFTCKRTRIAAYLIKRGFKIDSIEPENDSSSFNVYRFKASPELYAAVLDYTSGKAGEHIV